MADKVTARNTDKAFQAHPEGSFVAQCVDVIDMGEELSEFPGKPPKLMPKVAFVYRTGELNEDGVMIDLVSEFTNSLGELANRRQRLEQWRGKPLSDDQVREGVPLEKMEGTWALLGVAHKTSKKGRTYAISVSAVGLPKVMQQNTPVFPPYVRPKYLVDKKEANLKAATEFRRRIGAPGHTAQGGDPGPTEPEEEFFEGAHGVSDDDLPF